MAAVAPKPLTKDEKKRRALFVTCESKEHLHKWIKTYLGIDMPNAIIDPTSNSSPMDLLWEVYAAARAGKQPWGEMLAYAARDTFKTLSAAILEVLSVVHLQRSVAHMAAIESQAKKSQQYIKKFFNRPLLREFISKQNERTIEVTRYYDTETGESFSERELAAPDFDPTRRGRLEIISNYITIIICTVAGANSEHVPMMIVDEVDVVANPDAFEEAKMIPSGQNGQEPITLYTSTRKYSFGLVQKEIDKAHESGLEIRHWNLIDMTERCQPARHQPEKGRLPIYRSDDTLKAVSEKEYNRLSPDEKPKYVKDEGWYGCLHNCRLFAVCQGRLVNQPSNSKLLKTIDHVTKQFRKVSPDKAKAQLMCWKPSTEGLVYPNFDRQVHMLSYAQMASKITGEEHLESAVGYDELVAIFRERGMRFAAGMDHGFTHNFAVVLAAIDGARCYVFDVISVPELELSQKIDLCESKLKPFDPIVWPDQANPADNATFRRHGFKVREWDKNRGSVVAGIEVVRLKLRPSFGDEPQIYFADNAPCQFLASKLSKYHWALDAAGRATDQPDKDEDDECDALRYLIINEFSPRRGRAIVPGTSATENVPQPGVYYPHTLMRQVIEERIGTEYAETDANGKKGRFRWMV